MTYRLTLSARAERDVDEFLTWLTNYSPNVAAEYQRDLMETIRAHVLERPHTWPFFFLTGRPYRAYLYQVSRRTTYWLVYTIDDSDKIVSVLRFWNSARDPNRFVV
jgi:plasmid stabilization system protein ParE